METILPLQFDLELVQARHEYDDLQNALTYWISLLQHDTHVVAFTAIHCGTIEE